MQSIHPIGDTLTFETSESPGFTRVTEVGGNYYYGPYVDFQKAGIGNIDITNAILSIDLRAFQGGGNNNPYSDCNAFLRMYSLDGAGGVTGYRDFGMVYGPNSSAFPFGDWTDWNYSRRCPLDHSAVSPFTDYLAFDPTQVGKMRLLRHRLVRHWPGLPRC